MAYPLRITYPGAVYHVTARGNAGYAIVRDHADRQRFVPTLANMVEHYQVRCYAWMMMRWARWSGAVTVRVKRGRWRSMPRRGWQAQS